MNLTLATIGALAATWLALATAAGILLGRAIRNADNARCCCDDGYRVPDVDLAGQIR